MPKGLLNSEEGLAIWRFIFTEGPLYYLASSGLENKLISGVSNYTTVIGCFIGSFIGSGFFYGS